VPRKTARRACFRTTNITHLFSDQFRRSREHVVGATMVDAIDRATARASVIEAMQDPRALPLRYDEALLQVGVPVDSLPFAIPLARRAAAIGTSTLH